ncbi:S-layer homology domain-containing protein [Paenibacillus sp. MY03]|uniref:S-layer homology domain-containing protein n=1 Tax=Paenibacillus sp. MY03 TaxID=302980 RepID=UPI0015C5C49A|nr:S-layer homology domain-containing protein [Paenibacillus sp. MY03]
MKHKWTKTGIILLTALMLLSFWSPGLAGAADDPVISMKASSRESKVTVEVTGSRLKDLYAYQFSLEYDPKLVRFVGASSPITGFTVEPIVKGGNILFAHSKVGKVKGTDGEAALATFTFERIAGEGASFTLHDIKLVDSGLEMAELEAKVRLVSAWAQFKDIAGHWAEKSILQATELGWVAGYSDGTFRPQKQVTRAEFVTMLARALELDIPDVPELAFADIDGIPVWARGYISAAVEAGMIQGYGDGTFEAGKLISRAEMAAIIVRSQGIVPEDGARPSFADTGAAPVWAQPYIAVAAERGWIKGVGDNRFAPLKNATRAESAHLILAIFN